MLDPPLFDAKLVNGFPVAPDPKPLPRALPPEAPRVANPDGPGANGEAPRAVAANPVVAGFSAVLVAVELADLKTDVVELPSAPNGDCSDPAKEAMLDAANADADVCAGLADDSLLEDAEPAREANGETDDVFKKELEMV